MMRIDTKISIVKAVVEEADRGESAQHPQKTDKPQGQQAVPDPLDMVEFSEIDVVTISKGLRPIGEGAATLETPMLSPQTPPEAAAPPPPDADIKANRGSDPKDKTIKADRPQTSVNITEPEEVDTVRISKELKSALKSVIINDAGATRRVDIAQEAGVNGFLLPFLGEALPGWQVKLKKVYKRKSGAFFKKKKKSESEEGQEPLEEEAAAESNAGSKYYDEAGSLKLAGRGFINTADGLRLGFRLELNIKGESALALRGNSLALPPIEIDCRNPSDRLEDYRFSFETEQGDSGGAFKGQGYGLFVIDLVEVGTAKDGSAIYGVGKEALSGSVAIDGPWTEVSPDQSEG